MRITEISDWFLLRRLVTSPRKVMRFRRNHDPAAELELRLRAAPPLYLRGGRSDFHMFHRIYLRDEYRLNSVGDGRLSCVIDLGGNVGLFSARVAPCAERVIVCEPVPENFSQLQRNTQGFSNVVALNAAVAAEPGTLRIFLPRTTKRSGSASAHLQAGHSPEEFHDARALSFDELLQEQKISRCDLLKLDVEGSEYEIFHSMSDSAWDCIQRIHGEYHDVRPEDPRTRWENCEQLIRGKGFHVHSLPHRHKVNHGMFFAERVDLKI